MAYLIAGKFIDLPSRWVQLTVFTCVFGVCFASAAWFTNFWLMITAFTLFGFAASYSLTGMLKINSYALNQDILVSRIHY